MATKKNSLNAHEKTVNLFKAIGESIEDDPEAIREVFIEYGLDQDKLTRENLQLIARLKAGLEFGPAPAEEFRGGDASPNSPPIASEAPAEPAVEKERFRFPFLRRIFKHLKNLIVRANVFFQRNLINQLNQGKVFADRIGRFYLNGNPGIVLLAVVFFLTTLPVFSFILHRYGLSIQLSMLGALGVLLLVWALGGYFSYRLLKHAPPKKYAQVLIEGYSADKSIQFVSNEIRKLASEFVENRHARSLDGLLHRIENCPDWPAAAKMIETHQKEIKTNIDELNKIFTRQYDIIQRILELKYFAARQLHIPERQMCDYIFQFSPVIYHNRVLKYTSNCSELLELYHGVEDFPDLEDRLRALVRQNNQIMRKIRTRRDYQNQILKHTELLIPMHRFITEVSISGAIKEYSRTLSQVAKEALEQIKFAGDYHPRLFTRACLDLQEKLQFLYYKQRARGGFDLHYTCFRLCETYSTEDFYLNNLLENQARLLEAFIHKPQYPLFSGNRSETRQQIYALSRLFETVSMVLVRSRNGVIENFREFYRKWMLEDLDLQGEQTRLIITHSYSRTVREVLKHAVLQKEDDLEHTPEENQPKLFVFKPETGDSFKERLMMYDLKEENYHQDLKNTFAGIDKLMRPAKIMFILGAECYDKHRWVFHPEGISDYLKSLRSLAEEKNIELVVVIVAEFYKCYRRLIELPEYYKDRFDKISLYQPELIDVIISDKEILSRQTYTEEAIKNNQMLSTLVSNMRMF